MKSTAEKIAIMQAFLDGKKIEVRTSPDRGWREIDTVNPHWDWYGQDYRIKPEPKEIWVNEYLSDCSAGHPTKEGAMRAASVSAVRKAVHYREVIE